MLVSARLLVLRVRGSQLSFFLLNVILTNSIISLDRFSASQVALVVKNLPTNAGDVSDMGSVPGSGRSPGEGNGASLQYSGLDSSTDRGAWRARVYGVARSPTGLSGLTPRVAIWPQVRDPQGLGALVLCHVALLFLVLLALQ